MTARPSTALVLAGSRGAVDPVAAAKGLPHKAMVPVDGIPMLERVIDVLQSTPAIERMIIAADQDLLDHGLGSRLTGLVTDGTITLAEPKATPSQSVAHVLDSMPENGFPLLVTTADHPLLTVSMIEHFCDHGSDQADLTLGLAEAEVIQSRYPNAVRTFYRFKGRGYSGCNLFLFRGSEARRVVAFWQDMERHRKRPWRLVAAVGAPALLRFLLNRLSIDDALSHLSNKIGAKIGMVAMPFAEAAIDVDKPADLDLAETILRSRSER